MEPIHENPLDMVAVARDCLFTSLFSGQMCIPVAIPGFFERDACR